MRDDYDEYQRSLPTIETLESEVAKMIDTK
jgi:hypothetical protein